ncbi:MAG: sugar transferase [Patescibacteria group bacterium]
MEKETGSIPCEPLPEHPVQEELGRLVEKLDRMLRSEKSVLAKLCHIISPEKGEAYLNSGIKRFLDLSIAVPAAVITTPFFLVAGLVKKLEDGGSAFFIQERYQTLPTETQDPEMIRLWKVRSMRPDAEQCDEAKAVTGRSEAMDPRVTKLGMTLRKYKIDELPQLWQVVRGTLSMVGIRPTRPQALRFLTEGQHGDLVNVPPLNDDMFSAFESGYNMTPKSLSNLAAVRGSGKKIERESAKYDVFYSKNATLGLDLYILWLTIARIMQLTKGRELRLAMKQESSQESDI